MSNRPRPQTDDAAPQEHDGGTDSAAQRQPAERLAEPSWFHSAARNEPREQLVERYRQAWNRTERGAVAAAQRTEQAAPRPAYRELVQSGKRPPVRFLQELEYDHAQQDNDPRPENAHRKQKRQMGIGSAIALACGMAVISGAAVGFINARYADMPGDIRALFGETSPAVNPARITTPAPPQAQAQAAPATIIAKKPIATATLRVGDATGETNSLIPLDLHAAPAENGGDIFLKISGLPDTAYLTNGRRDGDKIWALSLDEARDVKLMVPQAQQSQIDLAVGAFEKKTGELAAPVKSMTIALSDVAVIPASAPPPSQLPAKSGLSSSAEAVEPLAIPQPTSTGVGLTPQQEAALQTAMAGDTMLDRGDLEGARQAYEKAWNGGAAAGAYGMARSFDPLVVSALKIKGAAPDAGLAVAWYQRAAGAGHAQAQDAIVRLKLKP
jgi:hypothetical protein